MSLISTRRKHEEILRLIALYRSHSCLWDQNDEASKSVNARKLALKDIAGKLNASSEDIRKKLHNLRSQYRREHLRMKRLKTNRPKWLYYNALIFLNSPIKSRQLGRDPLDALNDVKKPQVNDTDLGYEQTTDIDTDDDNREFEQFHERHNLKCKQPEIAVIPKESSTITSNCRDTSKKIIVIPRQSEQQDEYAVFGENVANELRSLRNNKSLQHALKCTILQAILDTNKAAYVDEHALDSYEIEETELEDY